MVMASWVAGRLGRGLADMISGGLVDRG